MTEEANPSAPPQALQANEQMTLVLNVLERSMLGARMGLNGMTHGGKRDLYTVFGYTSNLKPQDLLFKFTRQDIAGRIATAYPEATWSQPPEIIDDEESQDETEFEKAFQELAKKLKLWHYLARVDTLAQLGRFSVLLVGVNGGSKVDTKRPTTAKVAYLMPYGEMNATIKTFEQDPANERFGKPLIYTLSVVDVSSGLSTDSTRISTAGKTIDVHYSRCIHVAEGLLDNDVYGQSILSNIFNRLEDLEKVVGGGAEIFWLNGRGGLNLNVDKDAQLVNPEQITQDAEDFVNQLSRILKTKGMDVKPINMPFESPKDLAEIILQLISGATGIPKRILTGSEAGELASSQDEDNWLSRVDERRKNHSESSLLRPLIDLFIETGDLPKPKGDKYEVKWPDLVSLSEEKQADIALKTSQAVATYVNAMGSDLLLPPQQFVEEVLGMEYREDEIAELEAEQAKQEEEEQALVQEEGEIGHERQKELVQIKGSLPKPPPAAGPLKPTPASAKK